MSGLLEGWDWFDNGLQNAVRSAGYRPLNKSQSMMVLYISAGVHRPIEIARRMRLSRQAIRHITHQLIEIGMLRSRPDPDDGRSIVLTFTARSSSLRAFAEQSIRRLERVLESRIGRSSYRALREVLNLDWGPVLPGSATANAGKGRRAASQTSPSGRRVQPPRSQRRGKRRSPTSRTAP